MLPTDRRVIVQRFRDELGDWRLVTGARSVAGSTRVGDGDRGAPARASRGRRSRASGPTTGSPSPAGRRPRGGRGRPVPRRRRGGGHGRRRGRWVGLRRPVPGERGAGAAPAALPAGHADAALAAAPASRRPAGGGEPLRQLPDLVETYRECLADVFDLPALRDVLRGVERREIAVHRVETLRATPFARPPVRRRGRLHVRGRRPPPSGGPRRWPSTATCFASCWARRSSASCSTPRRSRRPSWSARPWSTSARRAPSTRSPTSCVRPRRSLRRRGRRADPGGRAAGEVARDAGRRPPRRGAADRRRGALDRRGGRRPVSRRHRRPAAARHAGRVPRET